MNEHISSKPAAMAFLEKALKSGQVLHAYIVHGQKGVGKKTFVKRCIKILHCTGIEKPCGVCSACSMLSAGTYPDAHTISSERSIGIDIIRDMIKTINQKPFAGNMHSIIIQDAEKMTIQAQNCLLKTLESPPGNSVFFLVTSSISALLATIKSRCMAVYVPPLSIEDVEKELLSGGMPQDGAKELARLSGGSIGMALEMKDDEEVKALRNAILKAFEALKKSQDIYIMISGLNIKKENAPVAIEVLETAAADILRLPAGGEIANSDYIKALKNIIRLQKMGIVEGAAEGAGEILCGVHLTDAVITAKKRLKSNVSWQIVIEELFRVFAGAGK